MTCLVLSQFIDILTNYPAMWGLNIKITLIQQKKSLEKLIYAIENYLLNLVLAKKSRKTR